MKTKFIIFLLFYSFLSFSQENNNIKEYYIIPNANLKMNFEKKSDRFLVKSSNIELNNFFNKKVALKEIYKAFPTSSTDYLKSIYIVKLDKADQLDEIRNLEGIADAYLREEAIELSTPNDYIDFDNNKRNTALDLIRAPQAWNLTTGDADLAIGISDATFDKNHQELVGKIIFDNNTSYSLISNHGSRVAGLAAGNTNNNLGSAWAGYNSKLAISRHSYNNVLLLSQVPGVRVINISMLESCQYNPIAAAVYKEVWEGNDLYPPVVIVAAAGNGSTAGSINYAGWCGNYDDSGNLTGWNGYVYPASYDHVISVGATNHLVERYYNDPIHGKTNWEDLILNDVNNQYSYTTLNDKVDIFAPGFNVLVAGKSINGVEQINGYERGGGTSYASPIVAGAAALILSINPSLTSSEVRDILINTADPIYQHSENSAFITQNGPGRLNMFRAVMETKCELNPIPKVDLMIRDSYEDYGVEPNTNTQYFYESIDIWVRNQPDGKNIRKSENVKFVNNNPTTYVYVRVTNNSCVQSTGNEKLKLYWAKASTSLNWPQNWDGSTFLNGKPMGKEIGTLNIPPLKPGEDTIVEFVWNNVPSPLMYAGINPEPWHFCLLARVVANNDPMTTLEAQYVNDNTKNNNNIAWKNISIVNINGSSKDFSQGAVVMVGNPFTNRKKMRLKFFNDSNEKGNPIFIEAEVKIKLDNTLLQALDSSTRFVNIEKTNDKNVFIVKGDNAYIDGINLNAKQMGTLYLSFNFLSKELTEKRKFNYKIEQFEGNKLLGGETYVVNKEYNRILNASITSNTNNVATELSSINIYEDVTYNWYDSNGTLIYSGSEILVNNAISENYKLEIISNIDGFKDYADLHISNADYSNNIDLYPNPTTSFLNIDYDLGTANGYILITKIDNNSISNNYILDNWNNTISINVSNYTNGYYNVALIQNGTIIKSGIFLKK